MPALVFSPPFERIGGGGAVVPTTATLAGTTDPNLVLNLRAKLDAAVSAVPIEPGQQTVSFQVTAVWELV